MTTSTIHSTRSTKSSKHTAEGVAATPIAPPAASSAAPVLSFASPPAISTIPVPPAGYLAGTAGQARGIVPIQAEQDGLEAAIRDLGKIPNYALFVGGPPLPQFTQMLTLAGEWTQVRNASFKYDQYAATQEGNVWANTRPMMEEFREAFAQAQKADHTLAAQLPGLVTFLGVKSMVAQRGASTKRANKKAEAEGKPAQHGQVGKQRKRAAEKAALAAASAPATSAEEPAVATPAPAGGTPTNGESKS